MKKAMLFIVLFMAIVGVSCNDERDNKGPEIEITSPEMNQVYKPGDKVNLIMHLKDDAGVVYFKYESYSNNHDDLNVVVEKELGAFVTDVVVKESFILPKNIDEASRLPDGEYILKVTVKDLYGNTSVAMTTYQVQAIP